MNTAIATAGITALIYGITGQTTPRTYMVLVAVLLIVCAAARWEAANEDAIRRNREWNQRNRR